MCFLWGKLDSWPCLSLCRIWWPSACRATSISTSLSQCVPPCCWGETPPRSLSGPETAPESRARSSWSPPPCACHRSGWSMSLNYTSGDGLLWWKMYNANDVTSGPQQWPQLYCHHRSTESACTSSFTPAGELKWNLLYFLTADVNSVEATIQLV